MDGIGPRLTGSPNMAKANAWTRDQLTKMGCVNAHLEDWGEFGMGWQQLNTWVRMTAPDTAVFIAQATPWSPSTQRPGHRASRLRSSINDEKDFDKYKGKLAGKIVLLGAMREVPVPTSRSSSAIPTRTSRSWRSFPSQPMAMTPDMQARMRALRERASLIDKIAQFFADEKVAGGDRAQPRRQERRRLGRHYL